MLSSRPDSDKVRVCMLVTHRVTGDGRVRQEAATLAACGHEVVVVGLRHGDLPSRETVQGFTIVRVRRDTLHGPLPRGGIRRALAYPAVALALLDYSLRAFALAASHRFDVLHAHDLVTLPAAWAAARFRRSRLVYDAHELFAGMGGRGSLARRVLRLLEAVLVRRTDRLIAVNGSIAAGLSRRYGVPAPVVILNWPRFEGPPLSREASALRPRFGLPSDVPVVLYQGPYMPHRGLENLVLGARGFKRAHLVLMGWGPLLPTLCDLIRTEGLGSRVHLADPVPQEDLPRFTAGADVGVIPYANFGMNDHGPPNQLFEYCAAGVPVVASRSPELVKVVEQLGIGRTFDPERPDDIAATVNALLEDASALDAARRSVAAAAGRFTWQSESQKLLEVYRALELA